MRKTCYSIWNIGKASAYFIFSLSMILTLYGSASPDKPENKINSSKVTTNKHKQNAEIGCSDCHTGSERKPVETANCLSCHESFEEVAKLTSGLDPNPHNSPHYGTELDCNLCHHEHSTSENFCSQCHEWQLKVP